MQGITAPRFSLALRNRLHLLWFTLCWLAPGLCLLHQAFWCSPDPQVVLAQVPVPKTHPYEAVIRFTAPRYGDYATVIVADSHLVQNAILDYTIIHPERPKYLTGRLTLPTPELLDSNPQLCVVYGPHSKEQFQVAQMGCILWGATVLLFSLMPIGWEYRRLTRADAA